jgi:hypothetical protein
MLESLVATAYTLHTYTYTCILCIVITVILYIMYLWSYMLKNLFGGNAVFIVSSVNSSEKKIGRKF